MIDCPNCDIKFSPEYVTCPRCNDFPTPRSERVKYLKRKTHEYADQNATREDLRIYLLDQGLNDAEVDDILADSFRAVRSENRSYGAWQLFAGILLMGSGLLFLGARILWLGLFVAGAVVATHGLVRVLTGKS